jgi:hypothetical protein
VSGFYWVAPDGELTDVFEKKATEKAPEEAPGEDAPPDAWPEWKGPHTCLSCGHKTARQEDEEPVPGTKSPVRYRHRTWELCQEAMSRPKPVVRQHKPRGRTRPALPTLEMTERNLE